MNNLVFSISSLKNIINKTILKHNGHSKFVMPISLTTICFFFISNLLAQAETSYEKVLSEIKSSNNLLCTAMLIPNKEFNVGIFTKEWDVEDLTMEQCGDIKTDSLKNSEILKILETNKLLDKLFIQENQNNYSSLNSNDRFEWDKVKMVIILSSSREWHGVYQVFIPITNKKLAKKLIKSISKKFNADYCFEKLKSKL